MIRISAYDLGEGEGDTIQPITNTYCVSLFVVGSAAPDYELSKVKIGAGESEVEENGFS